MQRRRAVGIGLVRIAARRERCAARPRCRLRGREQRAALGRTRRGMRRRAAAATAQRDALSIADARADAPRAVAERLERHADASRASSRAGSTSACCSARRVLTAAAAGRPADERERQIDVRVQIRIARAPPPYKNSEWSSNVPSPSGVDASLLRNAREQVRLIRIELRVPLDVLGPLLVVRHRVMALREADLGIGAEVELAAEHERHDAREVRLEREPLELVHELHVLAERLRECRAAARAPADPPRRRAVRPSGSAARPRARTRDTRRLARGPRARARASSARNRRRRSRECCGPGAPAPRAARSCRRCRTSARTRRADCSRSAAASSACSTTTCSSTRSYTRCRTCPRAR